VEGAECRARAVGLLFATVLFGCVATPLHQDGTGGVGAGGAGIAGNGGNVGDGGDATPSSSMGGMPVTSGAGGEHFGDYPGSCTGQPNPDFKNGGTCPPVLSTPVPPCTRDCCATCGIDAAGSAQCICSATLGSYASCTCIPPLGFPVGLRGGTCSPQGYALSPSVSGDMSLKGVVCTKINAVCFADDSTMSSPRGCICMSDGLLHCGSVHDWFTLTGGETTYN